ncbi:MAG: hypothetical protein ACD_20C00016G0009 [uncultured bacterium]|nr:MAG: hypothetical protein ACD_20C00016G0009 [uncultured bacterium]HBH17372.1 hypothetical protein [Cyanobacteria bacterium UBA9579]
MFKIISGKKQIDLNNITIKHDKDVSPDLIQDLYLSVGWQYRDIQDIRGSLDNSVLVTTAWDEEKLIGIARATGDGIFSVTIWDVAVKPIYQKQGVGKLILKSMLTKLDDCGIPLITLYVEWAKKDFYSKLGFETNINKVVGMYRYKNEPFRDKRNRRNE